MLDEGDRCPPDINERDATLDYSPVQIPKQLRETIERVHGEAGLQWLVALPALLSECRTRWSLNLDEPFEDLSYNLVLPGRMADGTEVVLKVGVPCLELLTEAAALSLFDGEGACAAARPRSALRHITDGACNSRDAALQIAG